VAGTIVGQRVGKYFMNTMPTDSAIAAVLLIAAGDQRHRLACHAKSNELSSSNSVFGPEYDMTVSEFGSRVRAEAELTSREKRGPPDSILCR